MSTVHCRITGLSTEQIEFFWSVFNERDPEKCWPWRRSCAWRGYGQIMFNNRKFLSHRLAWMLTNGRDVPAKMHICHRCDNPACCNPAHLYLAEAKENQQDCTRKGRKPYGENHRRSVLNDMAVRYIRRLRAEGEKIDALAKGFGVERTTICQVIQRITWKHVPD